MRFSRFTFRKSGQDSSEAQYRDFRCFDSYDVYMLRGEDGEVYDNIRFKTESLLKMDLPIAQFIGYINSLKPSVWSKTQEPQS